MIASINNKWDRIYLLLSETLMNTLIRYLVLSETTVFVCARNHPLLRTIRDLMYGCACVWAFFIRPSIVSSGNGWIFSDFRSIYSSLAEYLWGVCNTPLHGRTCTTNLLLSQAMARTCTLNFSLSRTIINTSSKNWILSQSMIDISHNYSSSPRSIINKIASIYYCLRHWWIPWSGI